ncbi:MAG: hypothetical protein MJ217_02575 [Bacilli bacterium]|nr:hypothetical protein [Bacilli bacterium]
MNLWTERSIDFAENQNYLDRLFEIYNIELDFDERTASDKLLNEIKEKYDNQDYEGLILTLFQSSKFPIDYAYVGFLREFRRSLANNPETVRRIGGYLIDKMTYEDLITLLQAPKKSSRRVGPMFRQWIEEGGLGDDLRVFYSDEQEEFLSCNFGVLCESDSKLKKFARQYLGFRRIDKGIDFIAKVGNNFIVGEAKFISAKGGTQDKSFKDIKSLIDPSS